MVRRGRVQMTVLTENVAYLSSLCIAYAANQETGLGLLVGRE